MTCHHTELLYRLQRLANAGTLLQLGAHPDDEDFGVMAYTARHEMQRAVYWSATRGEGGQNRIGAEQGAALGVLRTWESLAAREIDGGEALYGPFIDFGYSKSAHDTLAKWGEDRLVREIVRAIRTVQPQVLISRWHGFDPAMDQHGHHQAVGQAARRAWALAADDQAYADLELPPWQPRKLYVATLPDLQPGELATLGKRNERLEGPGFARLKTSRFDPLAGRAHQETGWLAINCHRSQGLGFVPRTHRFYAYFERLDSRVAPLADLETTCYSGLDPTLTGLADYPGGQAPALRERLAKSALAIWAAHEALTDRRYRDAGTTLLKARDDLASLIADLDGAPGRPDWALRHALTTKVARLEEAAAACLGLRLETQADVGHLVPGQQVGVTVRLRNGLDLPLDDWRVALDMPADWQCEPRPQTEPLQSELWVRSDAQAALTTPYWLSEPPSAYGYCWPTAQHLGSPLSQPVLRAIGTLMIDGQRLALAAPIEHASAFPGGHRALPLAVLPPVSLRLDRDHTFLPASETSQRLAVRVAVQSHVGQRAIHGTLKLAVPAGWSVAPPAVELTLQGGRDNHTETFVVEVPDDAPAGCWSLTAEVLVAGRIYDRTLQAVRMAAPGLPRPADAATAVREAFLFERAAVKLSLIDVVFPTGMRYGYIRGQREDILPALARFPVEIQPLDDERIRFADLAQFDAMVIGPNAYQTSPTVAECAHRLLDYVAAGGTLIVQYQGYGFERGDFAPYPFRFNHPHDRVTDETAPVTLLAPEHHLLTTPNRLDLSDFDGWVHDRGLYFFGEWDSHYLPILACHDYGETDKAGGLLVAPYGRGTYVYAGYSFHRQLPAGVPGAFRLFANLLAIPLVRIIERATILKRQAMFALMDAEQLQAIARLMSLQEHADGTYLAHEGEPSEQLYLLLRGQVEIVAEQSGQVIYVCEPGELLGELGVIGDIPRTKGMRALGRVETLAIDGTDFRALLHRHPEISDQLIKMLAHKLSRQ